MNEIEVSRRVDQPPEPVFDRIRTFGAYPTYSSYLEGVRTIETDWDLPAYALQFAWWRLSFETRTRVVDIDPPERIDWEVLDDLEAHGHWAITEHSQHSMLTLHVRYAPESLGTNAVSLPFGVSLDWVRRKAESLIEAEANRVLDRMVRDIENNSS